MAKRKLIPGKYQYDIGLDQGAGAHLVAWSTGLMVFFATLALAVNMGLNTVTQSWVSGLSGSLTVEIKPPVTDEQKAASAETVKKVLWMTKQHPARSRVASSDARLGGSAGLARPCARAREKRWESMVTTRWLTQVGIATVTGKG